MVYTFQGLCWLEIKRLYCWKVIDSLRNSFLNFQRGFACPRAGSLVALLGLKCGFSGEGIVSLLDFFN